MEASVELSTSVSRDFEGRGADNINVEYTQALNRILVDTNILDWETLCVVEGKYVWALYIDILVLNNGGEDLYIHAYICNIYIYII